MKYSLIEIVSDILNDIDGDFVQRIEDTDEALQVAQIVKSTYQAMMSNRNWPHTARAVTLVPFSDNEHPTHMSINENIKELISVFYDTSRNGDWRLNYTQMKYADPDAFLRHSNNRNSNYTNTRLITDPSGIKFMIGTNEPPRFYTSFNDKDIVFNSYDSMVDSTIQASKVQARAYIIPAFEMTNDFIPDLPDEAFSALIEEAKSKAATKIAQRQDVKAEQEATRQQRWLSRKAWKTHEKDIYPYNYGRGHGRYRKDPTFRRD